MGLQFGVVGKLANNSLDLLLRNFPTFKHTFPEATSRRSIVPKPLRSRTRLYESGMILADDRLPEWNPSRFFFDLLNGSSKLIENLSRHYPAELGIYWAKVGLFSHEYLLTSAGDHGSS